MLKKLLKWSLGFVLLLLLAVAGVLWYANDYLEGNQEKRLEDYLSTQGMSVAMREIRFEVWKDFPRVNLTVDSLVVRDTTQTGYVPDLINAQRIRTRVDLKQLLAGRIRLEEVTVMDANLHLEADSLGVFNTGYLGQKDSTTVDSTAKSEPSYLTMDWEGLLLGLENVNIIFIHPQKRKHIALLARETRATVERNEAGELCAATQLNLDIGTLAFNTDKGGYLQNTTLEGPIDVTFGKDNWAFEPTQLRIGPYDYELAADISPIKTDTSTIRIQTQRVTYGAARDLLTNELQEKIKDYFVSDEFGVQAVIVTPLSGGSDPEINLAFTLDGQNVKLKQHQFRDVHATGTLVNRLTVAEGGIPNSKKNIRVITHDVAATYLGSIRITTPYMHVAVAGKDPILTSKMHFSGPARAVSDYLNNDAFFFRRGGFAMDAQVEKASLLDQEDILNKTDFTLRFDNTTVYYQPADLSFPFRNITTRKADDDISFQVASAPLENDFAFELSGTIDNMAPLLLSLPTQQINTDVKLTTHRFNWTDFRALFGTGGTFEGVAAGAVEGGEEQSTETTTLSDGEQVNAMKTALLGLERAFNPSISMEFDTVGYYDVMTLTDFKTGLHITYDTLYLERTSFDWAGSNVSFAAKLNIKEQNETPFDVTLVTEHLDVNKIRAPLNAFGLQLPVGLETLPEDLHIDLAHRGRITDSIGIVPGSNYGRLLFDDGRGQLFSGSVAYEPSELGIHTNVQLKGDPQVVNTLFAAENFFFGEGHFNINLDLTGTPEDLPQVLRTGTMNINIDSTRILYRPGNVYIPVRSFDVNLAENRADYFIELVTDSTNRAVRVSGFMDRLANFIFPDTTGADVAQPFRIKADVRAKTLGYTDLAEFIQPVPEEANTNESSTQPVVTVDTTRLAASTDTTTEYNLRELLSATGGIFNSFRPDLSLRVDTFFLSPDAAVTKIATGARVRGGNELVLERTGFTFREGRVELDATYALDTLPNSPFKANWRVDNMDVGALMTEVNKMGKSTKNNSGSVAGTINLTGRMTGLLDEPNQSIIFDSTQATIAYQLDDITLEDWPQLTAMGKKALMAKRFERLKFAPLVGTLYMKNGLLSIPRTEIQSTALQLFIEGTYSLEKGPDLLVSVPIRRNIGRGILREAPAPTGYAHAGWSVYMVMTPDTEKDKLATGIRLGRRKYYKARGRLAEFQRLKKQLKEERKQAKAEARKR